MAHVDDTPGDGIDAREILDAQWQALPEGATISSDLLQFLSVFTEENGNASIPHDAFIDETLKAIGGLEGRIIRIEKYLNIL